MGQKSSADTPPEALHVLVADPLAKELACDCVAGFAQRRYEALAMVLEKRLHRPVNSFCGTKLSAYWGDDNPLSLIIGKYSDVVFQARELGRQVYPLAALTDLQASTTLRGLFVVRDGNPARSLSDLKGYRLIFGPPCCDEKHSAAIHALAREGVEVSASDQLETVPSCTDAANELMKLAERDRVAAVISDYAKVLLEGCHTIPQGSLRVIGETESLPFVTVFATDELAVDLRAEVSRELLAAGRFKTLLRLLESQAGFRPFQAVAADVGGTLGWTDFRGPGRDAWVDGLPETLDRMRLVWKASLDGRGLGGIAVTERWVLATDRVEQTRTDYLKMFDARTGELRFAGDLVEPSGFLRSKDLDFGNSIRATPVVADGTAFLLDAYGALYRWRLPRGGVFPPTACLTGTSTALLVDDFELVTWGVAPTPLLIRRADGRSRLIVNSCSNTHTLLALDPQSLAADWLGAGASTGYASTIAGTFGGRQQIVGYDSVSLGGWDAETGKRIWTVEPETEGDFNVPTPVVLDDQRLLVVTETNAIRIYQFDDQGRLRKEPVAENEDVANDTVTPVVIAGHAYCTSGGALYQLDIENGLQTTWKMGDKVFQEHVSLIADPQARRLLVLTYRGELLLFDVAGDQPSLLSRTRVSGTDEQEEIYAHPSFLNNRLYIRGLRSLKCFAF